MIFLPKHGGTKKEDVYAFQNFDVMFNGNYYVIPYEEDEFYMGVQGGPYFSIFFQKLAPVGDDDFAGRDYATGIDNGTFKNMPDTNFGANIGIFGGYEGVRLVLRYTRGFTNALQGVQANGSNLKGTLNSLSLTLYIGGKT